MKESKCCKHCNRSTLINYNCLKSQITWQLSEILYLVKELCKEAFFWLFPKREKFADANFKFDENGRKSTQMPIEILLEKKKLLLTSNIFFPSVFKRLKLQSHKTWGLFGKGLTVLLKFILQPYLSYTFTFFSSMKRLHSTVPMKLQNVGNSFKIWKSAVRKMRTYSFSQYI